MRWLANLCYLVAGAFWIPVLVYQALVKGKDRGGWRQRFGHIPHRSGDRPCIWIHGVSLGEINAARGLVDQLESHRPDVDIVVSTTTDTGFRRAGRLYPNLPVIRYPLDFSWIVDRALRRIRPSLVVLMELEVWHNFVLTARRWGIPVVVANGRLTQRSFARFSRVQRLVRRMFAALTWVGAQDERIAARFRQLGVAAERVEITGSVKWDTAEVTDAMDGADELARALGIDRRRPTWVCGSTGDGEEAMVLQAWTAIREKLPDLQLIIVPRKPERFDEVAALIASYGAVCVRRSRHQSPAPHPDMPPGAKWVALGDTVGELRTFYSLADVVFVGRSLVPMGGSDPMEVAALGRPIVAGPHTTNFADPVEKLSKAGALTVVADVEELAQKALFLAGPQGAAMGKRGQEVVLANQGATQRTVRAILRALDESLRLDLHQHGRID